MALFKFWALFLIIIISFLTCSEDSINSSNKPLSGEFVVDSLITNIIQKRNSVDFLFAYKLAYHFKNQHGSIEKFVIIIQDSIGMCMNFNNAYPLRKNVLGCFVDSVRLSNLNLNLKDSVKFDIGVSGVFWDYNFETSTFNGFLNQYSWADSIWLEIPK